MTTAMMMMRGSKRDARGGRGDRESRLHRRRRRRRRRRRSAVAVLTPCRLLWTIQRANVAKMHSTRAPGGLAGGAGLLLAAVQRSAALLGSGRRLS